MEFHRNEINLNSKYLICQQWPLGQTCGLDHEKLRPCEHIQFRQAHSHSDSTYIWGQASCILDILSFQGNNFPESKHGCQHIYCSADQPKSDQSMLVWPRQIGQGLLLRVMSSFQQLFYTDIYKRTVKFTQIKAKNQVRNKFLCSGKITLWIRPQLVASTICAVIFCANFSTYNEYYYPLLINIRKKQLSGVVNEVQLTICHPRHHQLKQHLKMCQKIMGKLITKLGDWPNNAKKSPEIENRQIVSWETIIYKYRYLCYMLVSSILHIYQKVLWYYIIYKILMSGTKATQIDPQKVIGLKVPLPNYTLTEKDVIMYALGIGFSKDPLREEDFKYTNQFHQDFTAFSTAGIIFQGGGPFQFLLKNQIMPKFNPNFVLHAEHKLIMIKNKVEIGVQYEHESEIADVVDKGKNALLFWRAKTYSRNQKNQKQLCFVQEDIFFFKGLGGFNFPGKGLIKPPVQIPKRAPDFKFLGETQPSQSFLYRLNTDLNPLHIDPKIAKSFNFQRPILHGAISYGTVARVITQELLKNDPTRLKQVQTRFIGHVYPGQSLQISVWKEGMMFIYDAVVKERKTRAIVGYLMGIEEAKL